MILSFADKETEKIFEREFSRKLPIDIQRVALRKLIITKIVKRVLNWKMK